MTENQNVAEKQAQLSELILSVENAFMDFLKSKSAEDSERLEEMLNQLEPIWAILKGVISTIDDKKYRERLKEVGASDQTKEEVLFTFDLELYSFLKAFRRYRRQIEDGSFMTRLNGVHAAHMHDDPRLHVRDLQWALKAVVQMWDRSQN